MSVCVFFFLERVCVCLCVLELGQQRCASFLRATTEQATAPSALLIIGRRRGVLSVCLCACKCDHHHQAARKIERKKGRSAAAAAAAKVVCYIETIIRRTVADLRFTRLFSSSSSSSSSSCVCVLQKQKQTNKQTTKGHRKKRYN